MSKLPAFQFYPGDWVQDTGPLSLAAKGAWIDLLCAMWRSQTRGTLTLSLLGYTRLIRATADQAKAAISELIDMGICDAEIDGQKVKNLPLVTDGNVIVTLINRRMVREEKERNSTRLRVERFRNADMKRPCNGNVTVPSSSSSSSSCNNTVTLGSPSVTENAKQKRPKKAKEKVEKHPYRENVLLEEKQYQKLLDTHGKDLTEKMLDKLSNSKSAHGYIYKSDYHAILSWVEDEVLKGNTTGQQQARSPTQSHIIPASQQYKELNPEDYT